MARMELWTGLAALKPKPEYNNFRMFEGKGAYVHIAAWAESQAAFEEHVKKQADELECILCELEDVDLMDAKMEQDDYPVEFIGIRSRATTHPEDTIFGTFHSWMQDDAN